MILDQEKPNWLALLVEGLTSPGKAFEVIAEKKPGFWKPAFLFLGLALLLTLMLIPKIQEFTLWTLKHGMTNLPPEQLPAALAMAPKVAVISSIAAVLVFPWVVWLAIAVLLKIYDALSSKGAPFSSLFAVAVYGYLPILIGSMIQSVICLVVPVANFQKVSLSLAAFLPVQKGFLYFFLTQCNPFTWWSLVLWGIGGAAAMKTKRSGGIMVYLFLLWLVVSLIIAVVSNIKAPGMVG